MKDNLFKELIKRIYDVYDSITSWEKDVEAFREYEHKTSETAKERSITKSFKKRDILE